MPRAPRDPTAMRAIGDRVQHLRRERNLTQVELADASGLHRTYIRQLEQGTVNPSWTTLLALARAIGLDVGAMVDGLEGAPDRQYTVTPLCDIGPRSPDGNTQITLDGSFEIPERETH